MSKLITTVSQSLITDKDLIQCMRDTLKSEDYNELIGQLDPFHPKRTNDQRREILKQRYHKQLISDGIQTGHFVKSSDGTIRIAIHQPLPVIAGYIFEAYSVSAFNESKRTIGKNSFLWSTELKRIKSFENFEKIHAIGTGFPLTKIQYPPSYNPTNRQFDIIFYRMNEKKNIPEPVLVKGTTHIAGIQIKAVTCNEKQDIILPLLNRTYWRVLTYLQHPDGMHSYDVCIKISRSMRKNNEISPEEFLFLEEAIKSPQQLGIDQNEVNGYYEYIKAWYNKEAEADEIIRNGVGIQIKETLRGSSLLTSIN